MILGHFLQRYFERLKNNSQDKIFTFSLNERMILNTLVTGIGICVLVGASVYLTDKFGAKTNAVGLWGQIYLFETLAMNIYFVLSLGLMWFTEKRIARPIEGLARITKNYYAEHATEEQRKKMIAACEKYADDSTEVGELVNAGHNPPLICQNGAFSYLKAPAGFVLAGIDEFEYKKNEITLNPGDRIFLYTDGVTVATDLAKELYGEERLKNFVNQHKADTAAGV